MNQLNTPSQSVLIYRDNLIKSVQGLYDAVNKLISAPAVYVPSPFKSTWTMGPTVPFADFCDEVLADPDSVVGRSYIGQLQCTNLPDSLVNAEARIDVTEIGEGDKVLLVTMYSVTTSPYHWECYYPNGEWHSWQVQTV